jgi:hypothetical protein
MPLIPMLINFLLPIAVEEAKKKLTAANVPESVITPQAMAVKDVATGALSSKTVWFALILSLLGIVEQYQGLLSQYIGQDKMGIILAVVGAISIALRTVTNTSLSEKATPKE